MSDQKPQSMLDDSTTLGRKQFSALLFGRPIGSLDCGKRGKATHLPHRPLCVRVHHYH